MSQKQPDSRQVHLLYLTPEPWPTFRADVLTLFGKYLPRHGLTCDLVTERNLADTSQPNLPWGAGQAILCNVPKNRAGQYLVKLWHNVHTLILVDAKRYQAIQVRDMSITALIGLIVARAKGLKFFYWLSYPKAEGQIGRAKARGLKGGMRFWFPLVQGLFGKWLLYRLVFPKADHIFVQSRQMQQDVANYGIPLERMTPVPMGVDTEISLPEEIVPSDDTRLVGKRAVVYLGTLDRTRKIEILFEMIALIKQVIPDILLVLVGDTEDAAHRNWLKLESDRIGATDHVLWTGWLPSSQAWSYVRAAEVGLSPFPRSFLLDSASPTKAVEYMALGLPVVVNDNPDQAQIVSESGAGLCVPLEAKAFSESVVYLLSHPDQCLEMGRRGIDYIHQVRGYDTLSANLAGVYHRLFEAAP
ncbi:MAG: glycosyltransferase [Gammaproteobacteria bacterium]